jgi:hypothetical protein
MIMEDYNNPDPNIPEHYYFNDCQYQPSSYYNPDFGLGWVTIDAINARHDAFKFLDDLLADLYLNNIREEECHHGLSLWLCEDPVNHYPPDNRY